MNSKTIDVLNRLEVAEWFKSIGKQDMAGVGFVTSWLHAAAGFGGVIWEAAHLEGMNIIRDRVQAKSRARYEDWNEHILLVKPSLIELSQRKTADVMAANHLPKEFWWSVCADLMGVLMESEYSDVIEPGFYSTVILDCYLKGHFPCGWEGEFPAGRLVVY